MTSDEIQMWNAKIYEVHRCVGLSPCDRCRDWKSFWRSLGTEKVCQRATCSACVNSQVDWGEDRCPAVAVTSSSRPNGRCVCEKGHDGSHQTGPIRDRVCLDAGY